MMPVLILCGGKGTRLAPLTDAVPKYLIDVCGQPFAYWQLMLLKEQGYREIVLLTGHHHDAIQAVIGYGEAWGLTVTYQRDVMPGIGPHGALIWAANRIGKEFAVLYGDSYLMCDYEDLEGRFRRQKLDALLTLHQGVDYGLRFFRRYPPRHATLYEMPQPFQEMGSHAGLDQLRTQLSERNQSIMSTD